jgi:predicted RNase H-like HicB family nuclease
MAEVRFDSYSEARARLKDLLDAAENGWVATVRRDARTAAVVDSEQLRYFLAKVLPARAEVVAEDSGWSMFLAGLPIGADGETLDAAVDEMIDALREYAADWQDHLRHAPNHQENWGLVQMVSLSTDDQLREWLVGERG